MSAAPLEVSNMASIGSELDLALRKAAAQTEPVWADAGAAPGLQIWRVEKFELKVWPEAQHGQFYSGDSYIVLHTEQGRGGTRYEVFFWLGSESSIDEKAIAAYKTVELSDLLDGKPKQFREVQHEESPEFRALFDSELTYLSGGVDSGLRRVVVDSDSTETCLYRFRRSDEGVMETAVSLARRSLNQDNCFVLDAGHTIYSFQGAASHPLEKYESGQAADRLAATRRGRAMVTHVLDEQFWATLGGEGPIGWSDDVCLGMDCVRSLRGLERSLSEASSSDVSSTSSTSTLYKLSDETGCLKLDEVSMGAEPLSKDLLDSANVMILDVMTELCIWVGADASLMETRFAWCHAQKILKSDFRDTDDVPIHMFKEGQKIRNKSWLEVFER